MQLMGGEGALSFSSKTRRRQQNEVDISSALTDLATNL